MHNFDWSQFTLFDHLIACLLLVGYIAFSAFLPLAFIAAYITLVRGGDL
ncbi:hypothetical protein [Xanthomonas phaseoli]|nr:hypothetical protein [Xanthomonas phaseoli]